MSYSNLNDPKVKDLYGRVGDDLSQLKNDLSSLISHTSRHTIPSSARDLSESTKERIHDGSTYAAEYLRQNPGRASIGLAGGLLLLGAVGAGIYYLCKCGPCASRDEEAHLENDFEDEQLDQAAATDS